MSSRLARDWRALVPEQRLALGAAVALFVTMLLPWYQQNAIVNVPRQTPLESRNLNAFQVFSFVEAAVLLVALAVIYLLYARAEGRRFQLPGSDGAVVLAAGLWTGLLLIFRLFDKPGLSSHGVAGNVGVQWGIFFALAAAGLLAYAGARMRSARRPEAPLARPAEGPPQPPRSPEQPRAPEEPHASEAAALARGAACARGAARRPRRRVRRRSGRAIRRRLRRSSRDGPDETRSPPRKPPSSCPSRTRRPSPTSDTPSSPAGGARRPAVGRAPRGPIIALTMPASSSPAPAASTTTPASVAELAEGLREAGYLPGESTALVAYLATKLGKPVLVEGPAGVGKTELAKALASYLQRELVRLQCYEGLDEAKALYEWNYRKQLLRIQAEADGAGWEQVQDDIFGEDFLLARPLMSAIASEQPVVLLIDEIDKTDQEFEAMLLEVLSDFQISIPELGRVQSRTHPVVVLTSNNSRELTEALKRRCLYLWLDYPSLEHELEIVRLHAPELPETVARRLVEIIGMVRELDIKKPPSIAESIDWARALLLLGARDIDADTFSETMSVIVKHRTDMDVVSERVGLKLSAPADVSS